ncbi:MAG: glycoside hydrolase family 5 protein [Oscillospiraceae bacterium]|nr:glycoside hydrolase family 5 protein [Oscillospiraceae bacterium]
MIKLRIFCIILAVILCFAVLAACNDDNTDDPTPGTGDPVGTPDGSSPDTPQLPLGEMRDISTMELVHDMGIGINLGNTLEATGSWIRGYLVMQYEMAWGSPIITEDLIKGYADAGFGVVRIPVAWSNLMDDDYTISPELMERVAEITDWVLKYDMYAIVNIHWDGGWWDDFPTEYDECMKKFTRIWEQICEHFKHYGDKLMLESANEELGWNSMWNRWSGNDNGKAESYALVADINQTFVDLVRASGGNNDKRHLLIAGYHTDVELTCDPLFEMPNDPANRCAVSVHYYTPPTFAILEEDASWGKMRMDWGTDSDYRELNRLMDLTKETFIDNGIPVIFGEFGSPRAALKDEGAVFTYITAVAEAIFVRGMCPVLWDITISEIPEQGVFFSRSTFKMIDPLMEARFREIAEMERS